MARSEGLRWIPGRPAAPADRDSYRLGAVEDGVEVMWSPGTQDRDHSWVRSEDWNDSIAFTKGKKYEFKFTRAGSDSIASGLGCRLSGVTMA